MDNKDQFIKKWYQEVKDVFNLNTSYCLLIDLLRRMRAEGLEEEDIEELGPLLLENISLNSCFESLDIVKQTHLGYTIKKSFDVVFDDIKEIKEEEKQDEGIDEMGVKKNATTDTYASSEPQIDLSGIEYEEVEQTEEFKEYLDSLRFENYE